MKKLFNSRFLFILATSIVVLILLTVGAFYLFDDDDNTFVKSGYVLNPLSSKLEKYFFEENVGYKENLSSMIEFVDVDKNTVSVLKDSFLHYSDESLSFLKKGALLDLDSIKGDKAVSFYNISNESVIEKKDTGYNIVSANGDIKLSNFIGRISDDKYIIVGNLNLKMTGNDTVVKGDYFEIVYVEEGIVNIENKDVKFQVASEDAVISVGTKLKVDLGDKKIIYNDKDVMSITAITIDGDENIEIIPKVEEDEDDEKPQGGGSGTGTGDGTGTGSGSGAGSGTGNGSGNGEGNGPTGEETDPLDEILITLKDARIGRISIGVVFEILNATKEDSFNLQVVDLSTGKTVDIEYGIITDKLIMIDDNIEPDTKYLFMVFNEKDNTKHFQKVFETKGRGVQVLKEYATKNSLSYKISIDEDIDISDSELVLHKYNEKDKKYEIAKYCYPNPDKEKNPEAEDEICKEHRVDMSELFGGSTGERSVLFSNLETDTIYTAELDTVTVNSLTLKENPTFTGMVIDKKVGDGSFNLSLGNIIDPDDAITKYTYYIYDRATGKLAIDPPIVHTNGSPLEVLIGDGPGKLQNNTNYYFNVVIEYFDNEKYIEYVTSDSMNFIMGDDPYITITPREDLITHSTIGATIELMDNSCLVAMPGRKKCPGDTKPTIVVTKIDPGTGARIPFVEIKDYFEVSESGIKYNLYLEDLEPGTMYNIDVTAILRSSGSLEPQELLQTNESKRVISTKYLSSFNVNWENFNSSANHVVNAGVLFTSYPGANTETPEETLSKMDKVVLKLYQGERPVSFAGLTPIKTVEISKSSNIDFKKEFYDSTYEISSSSTFGMSIEQLKKLNAEDSEDPGKLSEYYTLYIEAYADGHAVTLINPSHEYKISSILLLDGIVEPILKVEGINKYTANNLFGRLNKTDTIVGYTVSVSFDRTGLVAAGNKVNKIYYYVYDKNNRPLKFYNKDLELVSRLEYPLGEEGYHETKIYMDYGTTYETVDEIMSRGNTFKIGFEIELETQNNVKELYPSSKGSDSPSDFGIYHEIESIKEIPSVKMYLSKSTQDSVIYKYEIKDPDNGLYKAPTDENYYMIYVVNNGNEVKYPLTPVEGASYNQFNGEIVIEGLKKNDTYRIYYKNNITKINVLESDIVDNLDNYINGDKIFEGYYNPDTVVNNYKLEYQIINDETRDNKVGIKILADEELRKRIINYKLIFTAKYEDGTDVMNPDDDSSIAKLEKELWKLSSCSDDNSIKCLYVDYSELKNAGMKSEWMEDGYKNHPKDINHDGKVEKTISVSVVAYYDNGLSGYDYKVGNVENADYPYMIMQDDLLKTVDPEYTSGSYIVFTSNGKSVTVWTERLGAPIGYYTYNITHTLNGSIITLTSHLSSVAGKSNGVSTSFGLSGYSSKHGYMNPKMVSVVNMNPDSGNTFSFASITPKISVNRKTGIVNGVVLTMSLSGMDLSELRDNHYNLYIETWSEEGYENAPKDKHGSVICNTTGCTGTVRPTVVAPINVDNPLTEIDTIIDGLLHKTYYYFQVYIMKKDTTSSGYIYTQLYDISGGLNNITKAYRYKTAPDKMFSDASLDIVSSNEFYGDRSLQTTITLVDYDASIPYNYGLMYVLCTVEQAEGGKCGVIEENDPEKYTNILQKEILAEKVNKSKIIDLVDISDNPNIIFGEEYYLYVYAVTDYYSEYETNNSTVRKAVNVRINSYGVVSHNLRTLTEPTLESTREAGYINGDYYIDFTTSVKDPDRTVMIENEDGSITKGVYKIKLTALGDADGKNLLGDANSCTICLQRKNESGIYENISPDTLFNILDKNNQKLIQNLRVIGLEASSSYTFVMYASVDINNKGAEERIYSISRPYDVYTSNEYGVSFGDVKFNANKNNFLVTFYGGTVGEIVDKKITETPIVALTYTIQLVNSASTAVPLSDTYKIPGDKKILLDSNSGEPYLIIDPPDMENVPGSNYSITISVDLDIDGTIDGSGNIITLTNVDYPGFSDTVIYKDK